MDTAGSSMNLSAEIPSRVSAALIARSLTLKGTHHKKLLAVCEGVAAHSAPLGTPRFSGRRDLEKTLGLVALLGRCGARERRAIAARPGSGNFRIWAQTPTLEFRK
jgi:hypothetical protein